MATAAGTLTEASPFRCGIRKLGMWLFVTGDAVTFAAMLVAYLYTRSANPGWPRPFTLWPTIALAGLMTACLLGSSFTMLRAGHAMLRGARTAAIRWLLATMLGGALFVTLHLREWRHWIQQGLTPAANPWHVPLFGATFFALTGLHLAHVIAGLLYLGILTVGVARGRFQTDHVATASIYWHFVDAMWLCLFALLYLTSVAR